MQFIKHQYAPGDMVHIPSFENDLFPNKGEVISSRFAVCSLRQRIYTPQNYVTVRLQELQDRGDGFEKVNDIALIFPEHKVRPLQGELDKRVF